MTDEELIAGLRTNTLWVTTPAAVRIEQLVRDRKFILDERDRTFALMLTRTETAEAKLAKAVAALRRIAQSQPRPNKAGWYTSHDISSLQRAARTVLADLEKTE